MPDETPVDFTQTVITVAAPVTSRSASSLSKLPQHESLEGRFLPGTLLNGRYRIIAILGRGGMGEVYRATDLTLGQSVALKFLPHLANNDPRWLERFHSEVRIARQVSHPNVCRVYDIGESDGLPFLSMEYVDGEDLSTLLRRIGRLPSDKAIEISRKVCAGLAAAHDRGIIHRDLKPQNIMLDRRGEVLICDFGLAAIASELGGVEARQGTPAYMAPEQLKGTEVTRQSDIYSLGLVLYELFTGRKAYLGTTINDLLNQEEAMSLTSMSSLAGEIDPAIERVIRKCLDPIPAQRPTNALSVSAALPGGDPIAAALAAGQTPSPEMVAASKSEGLRRRYSIPLLAFSLTMLASMPFLGWLTSLDYTPTDLPPGALQARARQAAADFGYPDKPQDWQEFFESREAIKTWLDQNGGDWRKAYQAEPSVVYSYRQAQTYLPDSPDGHVLWNRPAFDAPGMVRVSLNSSGALRYFEAVPHRREDDATTSFDEAKLFAALGMDRAGFTEAQPFRAPLTPFDRRVTLHGMHPGLPNAPIDIQYGTWKGRLTSLYIQAPWSSPIQDRPKPNSIAQNFQQYLNTVGLIVFLFFSANLARKNWLANRADRRGAFRLFVLRLSLLVFTALFTAHWVPHLRMVNFAGYALGDSLFSAFILWQLYLALEPALRLRWPRSIVTWNRALAGNFADTQVGAHILMGVAMGIVITCAFLMRSWINFSRTGVPGLDSIEITSTREWIASTLAVADNTITIGLLLFFVIFGLRVLFRREIPAILAAAVLLTATNGSLASSSNLIFDASVNMLIGIGILFALVRFGLLTSLVAVFVANTLGRAAVSTDPSAWFMPYTFATLLLLASLAIYGFWRSLGGQHLVGDDPR